MQQPTMNTALNEDFRLLQHR